MSHDGRGRPGEPLGPLVVAGAPALDRRAFPRPGAVARWFEPFHVRQPQVARAEIAAQVAAGADVVVAPAWLTHRRALEAVGESRRAQAWTAAAVRLAREAVEEGLERRPDDAARDPVLVAGPLPDIAARPEHATGRLLPASASEERDTHDQTAILADAAVDLLLLEPRASHDATLRSTRVVAETGLPVWVGVPLTEAPAAPSLGERLAMVLASGATGVLVDVGGTPVAKVTETLGAIAREASTLLGVTVDVPPLAPTEDALDAWLEAGASLLGVWSGADPAALGPLVDARERVRQHARERWDAAQASLGSWVSHAARRAPGGRALWLGDPQHPLPAGFDWTVLDPMHAEPATLPIDAFRLVVALAPVDPRAVARLVERGGVVALRTDATDAAGALDRLAGSGLRALEVDQGPDGWIRVLGRREDD